PPDVYTLSLHDALPIWRGQRRRGRRADVRDARFRAADHAHVSAGPSARQDQARRAPGRNRRLREESALDMELERTLSAYPERQQDRKSTRLNSSHVKIS